MSRLELKIPPLLLLVIFAVLMFWLGHNINLWQLIPLELLGWRLFLAGIWLAAGVTVAVLGVLNFRSAQTTVNPLLPANASQLVQNGIFRYSRNPMYLGMLLLLIGWALWLSDLSAFVPLPFFVWYLNQFQIKPEERALTTLFGAEFLQYQQKVRRWL
ncbi:isoprenylcysteine carboxylmethyltransferase family protein [Rheinheimera sp.]|uniref:methyltransferase family protein n=1 Tax=Rheinheimera sp. TaxID=1869214 RepID=UPI0027B9D7F7|nr:isoprenylcysteine carboxylmethyltransferase family protein [Rheinheimera sp.]